jgi:hypothetical protein
MDRRRFLVGAGSILVGSGAIYQSGAFSKVAADRGVSIDTASGSNALLGVVGRGPVQKNVREPMVEFTNNLDDSITITVRLDNSGDGDLYNNEGQSGGSVTLRLSPGNTQTVDIEGSTTGSVTYTVNANAQGFSLDTSGSVEVQSGRVRGPIRIQAPSKNGDFAASSGDNIFQIKRVDIRDDDGDSDLNRIEFEVVEGGTGGTIVGYKEVADPPGDRYNPGGKPAVEVPSDSGHTVKSGATYKLEVTATDIDGNVASETFEDTANENGNGNGNGRGA